MSPLVSIIIPVYNVAPYLPRCLDSILKQSYAHLEVILVNDGSTDESPAICDSYAAKDERVRVLHKENEGVAEARNTGLRAYHGEYMMYVDPDDHIHENAVQMLLGRALKDGSEMVIAKHANVFASGRVDSSFCDWMCDDILSARELLFQLGKERYYPVANCAKLYARHVLEGLHYPPLTCGEDVWMFPLLVKRCSKISVVNETVYYYFQREGSLVHRKTEASRLHDIEGVLHLVQHLCEENVWESAQKWYLVSVDKALKLKKIPNAKPLFAQYLKDAREKQLRKGLPFRQLMKVRMLRLPWLYVPLRSVKNVLRRR